MCVCWQSLSGLQEHWNSLLKLSDAAIHRSVGGLCLTVTVSCYLASAQPHLQMELVNSHLVPLLTERGVELCWDRCSTILTGMPSISRAAHVHRDGTAHEKSATRVCEDGVLQGVADSEGEVSVEDSFPEKELLTVSHRLSWSYASLCGCLLSYMIPEALVDKWFSLEVISHSPSFLFFSGLVHTSWNRWPLVFDPQGLAFRWVSCYKEGVVHMDARDM